MTARKPGGSDHAAGTNGNGKTARRSYIAGIGASGALLAGAVVTFVFLVGTVSFEVWPEASERDSGTESLGVAELSGPGPAAGASAATLGEAVTILASSVPSVEAPASPKAQPGLKGSDGDDGDGDGGAPVTAAPVGSGDGGTAGDPGGGSGGSGGDNAPSDRPTNRPPSGGSGGGSTGGGTTSTPPTVPSDGGSNAPSDRPSGGRG
jgi:hypothetical protein